MDYEQRFGLMGPANLPQPVVDKLAAAMAQVLAMPRCKVETDAAQWVRLGHAVDVGVQRHATNVRAQDDVRLAMERVMHRHRFHREAVEAGSTALS